jgi:hypothetical protein
MARKASSTSAPSAAQSWVQTRAVAANRTFGRRQAVRSALPFGARSLSLARDELVDPQTDIYQFPTSANDPAYGGDTKGQYDEAVEVFEWAGDEYFDFDDEGFGYRNLGEQPVPVTSNEHDTTPVRLTIVPTNTTNPDRPRTVAAGYDKNRATVTVVFRDGTFYNYYDVGYPEWQGFRMSQSKGRYIKRILDAKPRGIAAAQAVPVDVRSALYNVARTSQYVAPDERWQQPDLAAIQRGRQARSKRAR